MNTIPITVLLHNSPIGRSYLGMLNHLGYRPEKIVLLVYPNHPGTGKPMGGWIPIHSVKMKYLALTQDNSLNYWPRNIKNNHPEFYESITKTVSATLDIPLPLYDHLTQPPLWEQYAERIIPLYVKGLKDPELAKALEEDAGKRTVLYTGGGIVPREVLEIKGLKMIHIHPGFLPDVKGSDGLLWSTLIRGRPGASCFYMEPGIDTGAIISREEFSTLIFEKRWMKSIDLKLLYRAVFSFVDPMIRAKLLEKVIIHNNRLDSLDSFQQDLEQGVTYYYMHPVLQNHTMSKLFSR